jgi:hypothetical protein
MVEGYIMNWILRPGMVTHAYNPDTKEVVIRRILVPGQPWPKVSKTPISTNEVGVPIIPAMWEV